MKKGQERRPISLEKIDQVDSVLMGGPKAIYSVHLRSHALKHIFF
jgi:hypothetical protein